LVSARGGGGGEKERPAHSREGDEGHPPEYYPDLKKEGKEEKNTLRSTVLRRYGYLTTAKEANSKTLSSQKRGTWPKWRSCSNLQENGGKKVS